MNTTKKLETPSDFMFDMMDNDFVIWSTVQVGEREIVFFENDGTKDWACLIIKNHDVATVVAHLHELPVLKTPDGQHVWTKCEHAPCISTRHEFRAFVLGRWGSTC